MNNITPDDWFWVFLLITSIIIIIYLIFQRVKDKKKEDFVKREN
jgi:type II secretory pathway component PulF